MISNNRARKQLETILMTEKIHLLWSYDKSKITHVSDHVLISKFLDFGNPQEWKLLKTAFSINELKEEWLENHVPASLNLSKQYEIARFFFDIEDPQSYIEQKQKEHLDKAIEKGKPTIQVFESIEELKADRVERQLSESEKQAQRKATESLKKIKKPK